MSIFWLKRHSLCSGFSVCAERWLTSGERSREIRGSCNKNNHKNKGKSRRRSRVVVVIRSGSFSGRDHLEKKRRKSFIYFSSFSAYSSLLIASPDCSSFALLIFWIWVMRACYIPLVRDWFFRVLKKEWQYLIGLPSPLKKRNYFPVFHSFSHFVFL